MSGEPPKTCQGPEPQSGQAARAGGPAEAVAGAVAGAAAGWAAASVASNVGGTAEDVPGAGATVGSGGAGTGETPSADAGASGADLAACSCPPAASITLLLFSSSIFCIRSIASFSARGNSGAGSPNFVPAFNPPHARFTKNDFFAASEISPCPSCRQTFAAESGRIG